MRRRTWLAAVGTALVGTAGCADLGEESDDAGEVEEDDVDDSEAEDDSGADDLIHDSVAEDDDEADEDGEAGGPDGDEVEEGDEDDPDPSDVVADEEPEGERTVRIAHDTPRGFDPDVAWVEVGGTVTWESEARDQHDTASIERRVPEEGEGWTSGFLEQGETFSRTFEEEGVYDYVCTLHETRMVASVLVGEPDPEGQPGLAEPGEEAGDANPDAIEALNERTRALLEGE
jgi:plastocyanin